MVDSKNKPPAIQFAANALFVALLLTGTIGLQPADVAAAPPDHKHGERQVRPLLLPTASVSLGVPSEVMIGASFSFTATFDNTSATDTGYGPFIDIAFPVTGADGAGAQTDDGINFASATYLGASVTAVQNTFGTANTNGCTGGLGPITHPYAVTITTGAPHIVCGTPGDKLVTLQLPFGSFTPDQPAAVITVNATLSNLADANTALIIRARGGYQYGATPTNDWCCSDASIVSHPSPATGWPGSPVTPTVLTLAKTYNGPENETATGPNYPRQYTLTVDIAAGQTVTDVVVTDTLPDNMQFVSVASTTPAATCVEPSTSTPGGTLSCNFGSVTGAATTSDASLVFNFHIPLNDSGGGPVIDASSGDDVTSLNTSSVTGNWTPLDSRDLPTSVSAGGVCPTGCHTLTDKSIAIQKSVANVTDSSNSPGDTLEYTLEFQISDFFSFQNVILTDVISDGQRVTGTPTLEVNGNGFTSAVAAMNAANYTIDNSQIGNSGPNPPSDGTDGTQTITFRVSAELVTRGESGKLIGGCIPVAGTADPDCGTYNNGATTGTVVFRTIIQQNFTDTYPSGDPSVDHGDILEDDVMITGDLLSVTNNATATGSSESDDSAASLSIAFGTLTKSVYAVNGTICTPCTTEISTNGINPGDTVTFRMTYTQPTSDFEQTIITDYLPLPIFDATTVTSFSNTVCGVPASGNACLGPADTYHSLVDPNPVVVPTMSNDGTSNFVRFTYAAYDSVNNTNSLIDLLFTVTVSNQPFADGLFLTNQANSTEGTTNAGSQALNTILQIKISEPLLIPKKSAVSTNSTAGGVTFTPAIGAPIVFDTPGTVDGTADWTGGIISSNYLASNPINADLTGIDAGDLVKFAIVIENQGHSIDGAFDIAIKDAMPAEYVIPASGLNLEVFLGDGVTTVTYSDLGGGLFGSGIQLVDPGVPAAAACQAHNGTSGLNVIIITYDLELSGSVALSQNIINTTTLLSYSSTEGGPNYIPSGVTDTATITPISAPVKSIVTTSESHTTEAGAGTTADPRLVAIGEIARFRLVVELAEGSIPNFRLRDNIPTGLLFLDDGTAKVVFVSTGGNITSSTLSDAALNVVGNETTVATITPTFQMPDAAVSASETSDNDTYVSGGGTDVWFKTGDLTNPDRDDDREYIIVEFNALVENIAGNGTGTNLNNTAIYRVGTSTANSAASNTIRVRTTQPSITMGKTITSLPSPLTAGSQVSYRITVANGIGANVSTAFDVAITDTLPSALALNLPLTVTTSGGAVAGADTSSGNSVNVTAVSIPAGGSVTVDYTATLAHTIAAEEIVSNTSTATWTSLPGTGTQSNGTGSNTPGGSGATNGERSGSGASPNTYTATSNQQFTEGSVIIEKRLLDTSSTETSNTDVIIGEEITFGILLTFPAGTTASDTVVDDLPTGLEYVSGSAEVITTAALSSGLLAADYNGTMNAPVITSVSGNGGSVTFALANVVTTADGVTNNNTILLRFRARVTSAVVAFPTTISNEGTNQVGAGAVTHSNAVTVTVVDLSTPAPAPVVAGASGEIPIIVVDPTIAKRLPIENAQVGDAITFFITVTNPNGMPVSSVSVDDPLPLLVDFVGATMTQGAFSYNPASHTVTFNIGTMPAGQVVEISVNTKVNEQGQPPTDMCNEAQMRVNGQLRATSGKACAHILPAAIPGAGIGPGAPELAVTILLWLLVAASPLAAWLGWKSVRRKA